MYLESEYYIYAIHMLPTNILLFITDTVLETVPSKCLDDSQGYKRRSRSLSAISASGDNEVNILRVVFIQSR